MLPLFDSGAGSFYDLKHLSLTHAFVLTPRIDRLEPRGEILKEEAKKATLRALLKGGPNRARWEYHRVHLQLLYQLANVIAPEHAVLWNTFFDRWLAYMWGFRSDHN